MDSKQFGQELASILKNRSLTITDFAAISLLPEGLLEKIVSGTEEPLHATLVRLASALDVPFQYLEYLGKTPPEKSSPKRELHDATVEAIRDSITRSHFGK